MKRIPSFRMLCSLVPIGLALVACGGGGGDSGGGGGGGIGYVAATSGSFAPSTAKDKTTNGQNVALHWVYAVNDGQPIQANLQGVSVGVTVATAEATLDPAGARRLMTLQGTVAGVAEGTPFSGDYTGSVAEDLMVSAGKTLFTALTSMVDLTLTGGGETVAAQLTAKVAGFAPPYAWFLDRETLDQLPIGHVQSVTSNASVDVNITITNDAPIVSTNQPTTINDRWTVLEKLPTMSVRGKSYSNVVKLSRQTPVPDFSGNLTTVTMYYWVAKGIGMIRGVGILRVLNIDDVVYELTETNLTQL